MAQIQPPCACGAWKGTREKVGCTQLFRAGPDMHGCAVLSVCAFVSPGCKYGIPAHEQLLPVESCRKALALHSDHFLLPVL